MANVYTIQQLTQQVSSIISREHALISKLLSLEATKETLFSQNAGTALIATTMNNVLDECDELASLIATDLDAIPMTVWAEAVHIGGPVNYKSLGINVSTKEISFRDESGTLIAVHLFTAGDVVEIVNPEDKENAQEVVVSATVATTGFETVDSIPGGVANTSDERGHLVLRER